MEKSVDVTGDGIGQNPVRIQLLLLPLASLGDGQGDEGKDGDSEYQPERDAIKSLVGDYSSTRNRAGAVDAIVPAHAVGDWERLHAAGKGRRSPLATPQPSRKAA